VEDSTMRRNPEDVLIILLFPVLLFTFFLQFSNKSFSYGSSKVYMEGQSFTEHCVLQYASMYLIISFMVKYFTKQRKNTRQRHRQLKLFC
jgi:hypothetical protein